ncbi:Hypothetical predicted protein [Olea europaea subsp. europaea]|uniref:Uncharacterized protein n=1 Tax=Olea europaea subsp. europaea TaxID=158383 RepID=A0A8S0PPL1_OLEEU|nr:Hypothetical predicted protein [Olea europaea subsp. europaea]
MFGTRLGRGSDVARFLGISRQFLGHGVQALSRMLQRPGCVLASVGMQPDFKAFVGSLWARCAGHVRDGLGRSLIFRHFWDSVYKRCPGLVMGKVETEFDFQAILGSFVDTAMSGMRLVRDRDAALFSSSFRDTVVSRKWCTGDVQDAVMFGTHPGTTRTVPDFQAVSGVRCASQVWDASSLWQGSILIFRHFYAVFWDTVCRPRPGRDRDAV